MCPEWMIGMGIAKGLLLGRITDRLPGIFTFGETRWLGQGLKGRGKYRAIFTFGWAEVRSDRVINTFGERGKEKAPGGLTPRA